MAYLIGNDLESGIVRPTLPRKASLPGKPVGLHQPRLEDVDPDMADRLRYTQNVYGGDAVQTYQLHRAAIDAQYDYNLRRALTGKELVPVADPAWNPSQYDDDTNDAIVLWYKQHGNIDPESNSPTTSARTFFNPNSYTTGAADKPGKNYLSEALKQYGFDPQSALSAGVGAGSPRDDSGSRAKEITQQWKNYAAQTATQNQNIAASQYVPGDNGQSHPVQATQGPEADIAQPQPANPSNAIQDITDILKGFNEYVLGYPKSFLLNTLNQAQQLIYGEPYSYDPHMTFADYTAATARRMGGTDVSQFVAQNMAEIYQSPQYKAYLAKTLGVSQDSQVVQWMSGLLAGSGNMVLEGAADPINYFTGAAATKALKGGSITAKMGTPAYEKALYSGRFTQDLPPLAAALEDAKRNGGEKASDIAPPTVADDVAKGYTGGHIRSTARHRPAEFSNCFSTHKRYRRGHKR